MKGLRAADRLGLVGHTGFVGGNLLSQCSFSHCYNSSDIRTIADQEFDALICAGAPATMWMANNDPARDAANLNFLIENITRAKPKTVILISTVAVFDDVAAGYTESSARYETDKAYGRNRRNLEVGLLGAFPDVRIIRLPALFGRGLKKNFIFDLLNPAPSFLKADKFESLRQVLKPSELSAIAEAYVFDDEVGMWRLRRSEIAATPLLSELEAAFERVGIAARDFTNSDSRYQFYNVERLADDIEVCLEQGIQSLNICSESMSAREIHQDLIGYSYENDGPARVTEDVRTEHSAVFGGKGPYLYDKESVLKDLRAFFLQESAQ